MTETDTEVVKKVMVGFSERHLEMIAEIKKKTGINMTTAIIRNALVDYHKRLLPDYVTSRRDPLTPEQEAERREQVGQAKIKAERDTKTAICDALGGKVVGNSCVYFTFSKSAAYEQTLPLSHLDETLIEGQFFPDRETIEAAVASGKLKAVLPPKRK